MQQTSMKCPLCRSEIPDWMSADTPCDDCIAGNSPKESSWPFRLNVAAVVLWLGCGYLLGLADAAEQRLMWPAIILAVVVGAGAVISDAIRASIRRKVTQLEHEEFHS
jgi:hypothetical protein